MVQTINNRMCLLNGRDKATGSLLCPPSSLPCVSSSFLGFPYEKVTQRILYLQVLDYDRFSRNDPIGEVSLPLGRLDLTQMLSFCKELKPCADGSVSTHSHLSHYSVALIHSLFLSLLMAASNYLSPRSPSLCNEVIFSITLSRVGKSVIQAQWWHVKEVEEVIAHSRASAGNYFCPCVTTQRRIRLPWL